MSWWFFRVRTVAIVTPSRPGYHYIFTTHDESKAVARRQERQAQIDAIRRKAAIESQRKDQAARFRKRA